MKHATNNDPYTDYELPVKKNLGNLLIYKETLIAIKKWLPHLRLFFFLLFFYLPFDAAQFFVVVSGVSKCEWSRREQSAPISRMQQEAIIMTSPSGCAI